MLEKELVKLVIPEMAGETDIKVAKVKYKFKKYSQVLTYLEYALHNVLCCPQDSRCSSRGWAVVSTAGLHSWSHSEGSGYSPDCQGRLVVQDMVWAGGGTSGGRGERHIVSNCVHIGQCLTVVQWI